MNYRKILQVVSTLMLVIVFNTISNAQEISGIITDSISHEAVAGAVVTIDKTFDVAITDANGKFVFSGINSDEINVVISHIAYATTNIKLHKTGINSISILRKEYLSEEVSISATRVSNSTSISYSDISKAEIENENLGKDLPFLLNHTPSVVVTSDAGTGVGYTGIRIRGSDATRINVTINGIPVNDPESHQTYWVDIPDIASSVENIQIQRGIGSSVNGAGAFGGSLNILTNKLTASPFATISSSAGSFNTFKNTVSFGSGLINSSFAFEGRLSKISSDGYIDRASTDLQSYFLSGGFYGKHNSVRAVVFSGNEKTYQSWYGVPQEYLDTNRTYNPAGEYFDKSGNRRYYDNQTDNYRQDYYQLFFSHEFSPSLFGNIAFFYTRGKGYYEEYKSGETLSDYNLPEMTIGDSIITNADLVRRLWLSNHFYGATGSLDWHLNKFEIKAGVAGNIFKGDHYGEVIASEVMPLDIYPFRYYFNDAKKSDISAFLRTIYKEKYGSIFLDLQQRFIDYSFDGFDDAYLQSKQNISMSFFNPKAGIRIDLSKRISLFGSVAFGHKEPVRDDFVYSTPSKRPQAERMIDYESGVQYNSGPLSVSLNGYYMNYLDQLILTGKINDVGEYIRENVKSSYRTGIEAEGTYNFTSAVTFYSTVTISKNKIRKYKEYVDDYDGGPQVINTYKNTDISFSPSITGTAMLTVKPFMGFSLSVDEKYVGKQFLDNTSNENRKIEPYFITGITLNYGLPVKKFRNINLKAMVNNVFNATYSSNGYSYSGLSGGIRYDYNYYFPQAGINWMAGLDLKF